MTKPAPTVHPLDLATVAAGVAALVLSFRDYYTVSVGYVSESTSAWHGFFGWFGTSLAVAGAAVVAVAVVVPPRRLRVSPQPVAALLFALGAVSTLVALFTSGYEANRPLPGVQVETGHGYGYWTSLAVIVAGAALAAVRVPWPEVWRRRVGIRGLASAVRHRRRGGTLGFETEAFASTPPATTDQRGGPR
jgi:hypothetical protein